MFWRVLSVSCLSKPNLRKLCRPTILFWGHVSDIKLFILEKYWRIKRPEKRWCVVKRQTLLTPYCIVLDKRLYWSTAVDVISRVVFCLHKSLSRHHSRSCTTRQYRTNHSRSIHFSGRILLYQPRFCGWI